MLGSGVRMLSHGALRELSDRLGARDGFERLFRGNVGHIDGHFLASGARRGVLLWRAVLDFVDSADTRDDHQQYPKIAKNGDRGWHWRVPDSRRAEEREPHG